MKADIRYGKHNVSFYRTHPVRGLLAGRVSIDVFGDNFLPAYTEGDNREVVATDTMKNFVYAMALEYPGATHEGFAAFLGRRFLETYPQMQWLRIQVREMPFDRHSAKLLSPTEDDYGWVELEIGRDGMRMLRCGRRGVLEGGGVDAGRHARLAHGRQRAGPGGQRREGRRAQLHQALGYD